MLALVKRVGTYIGVGSKYSGNINACWPETTIWMSKLSNEMTLACSYRKKKNIIVIVDLLNEVKSQSGDRDELSDESQKQTETANL